MSCAVSIKKENLFFCGKGCEFNGNKRKNDRY